MLSLSFNKPLGCI